MSLYDDFTVHDPVARMWPQTEWLKAATKLAVVGSPAKRAAITSHLPSRLQRRFWCSFQRRFAVSGTTRDCPMAASSTSRRCQHFYHILCAIYEASENLKTLQNRP